jgi:chromosome segregation ATPase
MQRVGAVAFALLSLAAIPGLSRAGEASPVGKVVQLISDLQAKVLKEGEEAQRVYAEYSEWCEDRARELSQEIKTGSSEAETLEATISEKEAQIKSLNAKLEELATAIATDEADLKAATEIRGVEEKDFKAEESELTETISMLERAVGILEREMAKGGASMLQTQNVQGLAQAFAAMVQASMMSSADATRLTALVQQSVSSEEADDDQAPGAPAAAVYESQSGNIVETLRGMLEKAEGQLDSARKKETSNVHTFERLKQSLKDELRFANKDMSEAKASLAANSEEKAEAEGELTVTKKDLAADRQAKDDLHASCMEKAEDFEAETKSRGEELRAIAEAKKVIQETTGGAEDISYGLNQVSFIQAERSHLASAADLRGFEAVRRVRDLAKQQHSAALTQLAQHLAFAEHSGADPFAKIKGLLEDMISKLEAEAEADATKKAYCDKELAETNEKKADKTAEVEKLTTKIDQMTAKSTKLKEEVAELQKALAKLAAAQAEMDKLRQEEHELYVSNKADMEKGLDGVKMALKVLKDYYAKDSAHGSATGAGDSIIGLLEVVESDFSKDLAEIQSGEETAAAAYDKESKENAIEKTTKEKDVEYKQKESAYLDKESGSLSADRSTVQEELDAVLEYLAKIEGECTEVAETYEQRKEHREAEIAGLKDALETLESETAFLQRRTNHRRHGLRGGAPLAA